jgi:hypothetical protein
MGASTNPRKARPIAKLVKSAVAANPSHTKATDINKFETKYIGRRPNFMLSGLHINTTHERIHPENIPYTLADECVASRSCDFL